MNQPAFTFDDVVIPPSLQIGAHAQLTWELSYVIIGSGTRIVGDCSQPIVTGEVILVPPAIPHQWDFDGVTTDVNGNIANITVTFTTAMLNGLSALFPEISDSVGRLLSLNHAVSYSDPYRDRIAGCLTAMRGLSADRRLPLMVDLILLAAVTDQGNDVGSGCRMSAAERKMKRVEIFCKCNFARRLTLSAAADHFAMNRSAFCSFIRRRTGLTFTAYLNTMRLQKAAELLKMTDLSISTIAYDVGFSSVTYFNRLFLRHFSMHPTAYRHSLR